MTKELASLLGTFVSFETIHENVTAKQECADWLTGAFFNTQMNQLARGSVEGCPYLYLKNPDSKLLLFAHFDVVPGRPDQFTITEDNENFYGRGVKDMKGAALTFLLAYKDAVTDGEQPPVDILLTSDEEVAGDTIPQLLDSKVVQTESAFTPDTGSEPWIVTEHKGVVGIDVTIPGKSGHASEPWKSNNPIQALPNILEHLSQMFPAGNSDSWGITVTPTLLQGSDARNKIPNHITLGLDVRYTAHSQTPEEILKAVTDMLPSGSTASITKRASPHYTAPDHPHVQLIKGLAEELTGGSVEIGKEHGGTDARYFGERGIPAFLYGPIGGDLHGEHEWVSKKSLEIHYNLYRKLFVELSKE